MRQKSCTISTLLVMLCLSCWPPNVLAQIEDSQLIPQQDLVYFETTHGQFVIQLLPQVAPAHVERFKQLVRTNWYNDLSFYRVIEGFVAQAGEGEQEWQNIKGKPSPYKHPLKAEFTQPLSPDFHLVQSPELLAPETGYWLNMPAGRDLDTARQWLLHCPGIVAMARGNDKDSASTEFYVVIGQAPRHLDRNMSIFGRVIKGMENIQKMPRGERSRGGIIDKSGDKATMLSARLGPQLEPSEQLHFKVQSSNSLAFNKRLNAAKKQTHPFFVYPGSGNVDVCYYAPSITVEKYAN